MLDPNIAMGYRGMQLDDPMERAGKAMSLSNMGMQSQFMQSRMDEQNRLSQLGQNRQRAYAETGGDPDRFLAALQQSGDLEGAQAFQEHAMKQRKDHAELKSKGITDAKGLQELRVQIAQQIKAGGTPQHVQHGMKLLQSHGDEEGVAYLMEGLQQRPNPTREEIAAYLDPVISSGLSAKDFSMPDFKDTGGQLVNVNPNAQFDPLQKTQTPDSLASNAVSREGHAIQRENSLRTDARARESNEIASKPTAGYRYRPDGNLEPIPGGPADAKNDANAKALEMREKTQGAKAEIVIGKIDDALKQTGFLTTGFIGKGLSFVPGTDAYDLDKTVDTIKANIGFQELADMRAASPTGGALGQVAVKELEFLQAALGQLDVGQSERQQRKHLLDIKKHYGRWKKTVDQAAKEGGGNNIDSLLEKYK